MDSDLKTYHVLGLMSGSSLDGIDLAYCSFTPKGNQFDWRLIEAATYTISEDWKVRLNHLPEQSALTFVKTHTYFGHYLSKIILDFIEQNNINPDFIASHGHTIFHDPNKRFTTQIGCGAAISAITGIPVVSDFRIQDIAIDGEGTPLAPAADRFLFTGYDFYMNIGGIANLTAIHGKQLVAFDIAPANQILNYLAQQLGFPYDKNGDIARRGNLLKDLSHQLSKFTYYDLSYPKSIGNDWIRKEVLPLFSDMTDQWEDKLHTSTKFIAYQISKSLLMTINKLQLTKKTYKLLVTGGGALNKYLIDCIKEENQKTDLAINVVLPEQEIIDFKEAILMGLLGVLRIMNRPNCFASVTGAKRDTIGGVIHQGNQKLI